MSIRRYLLTGLILGHTLGWLAIPQLSQAVSHTVLISEVQMAGSGSGHASEEFVELYNATDAAISLDKWTLRYHSSSATDCTTGWTTKYTASKVTIAPNSYWLIASTVFTGAADGRFTAGLASAAGAVRITDGTGVTIDTVGWGSGNICAEGAPATTVTDGHSLERRPGEDQSLGGNSIDTDDNSADMLMRVVPEPQVSTSAAEIPGTVDSQVVLPVTYLPLEVSELLVDPVSPATDAHDEFIEIHNTNTEPVQVAGYSLKTSASSYHLLPVVLPADGYLVIMASESHIALANTGGTLELDDPTGATVYKVAPWPVSVPGAGWASFTDGWRWTTQPSPAAPNILADIEATPVVLGSNITTPQNYLPLRLNEVFPDPVSPQIDTNDEFVEIYNPNDEPVDMGGYVLKTGSNLGNTLILPTQIIPPQGYGVVQSGDSNLTLANSGSSVQLLDPAGVQQDLTAYGSAKTGQSWMLADGIWAWTTTPTISEANLLTVEVAPVASPKAVKISTAKVTKVKVLKVAKVATPKVKSASIKKTTTSAKPLVASSSMPGNNRWLLFVLAGLTIGYIIYEFRYDLRNYYYQLKRYAGARR